MNEMHIVLAAALACGLPGCGDDPEVEKARKEIGEAADATKELAKRNWTDLGARTEKQLETAGSFVATEGREFAEKVASRLEALGIEISNLEDRARIASEPLRDDAERRVEELKKQYADLKVRVQALMQSSAEAAGELQEGIGTSIDAMQEAIDDARARFTQGGLPKDE